jgi:hypothetical protein
MLLVWIIYLDNSVALRVSIYEMLKAVLLTFNVM